MCFSLWHETGISNDRIIWVETSKGKHLQYFCILLNHKPFCTLSIYIWKELINYTCRSSVLLTGLEWHSFCKSLTQKSRKIRTLSFTKYKTYFLWGNFSPRAKRTAGHSSALPWLLQFPCTLESSLEIENIHAVILFAEAPTALNHTVALGIPLSFTHKNTSAGRFVNFWNVCEFNLGP